ncbi:unnamed protein product [Spirodela intermedia]|uniref:Protein kinase domain-containing protein n=1 Tax=Spirodela intermedia TaxID=51605 RepID=A0A7I8IF73_SPIIN|nr:unnamed protein product [Spirodela intermedia]CAA6656436.1 unnamed protein product [Spirodela intermedia]
MEAGPPSKAVGPPALLGKYELGRLLGRGTFAKVYYAKPSTAAASVAASMQHRVLREISAMSRLQHHPNVLRLHEVMATRSKIFLVMELAAGGDLLSVVSRRGRLPEAAAHHYFRQLVSALRFCHARGVAHRDLKLANLLIDGAGYLKVSDFGLSSLAEQRHGGDGLLRTASGGYDGARADAWSCGVVLYAMLAGRLPFDDGNLAVMYRKIYNGEYQFPAWFSPAAKRVISGLLDPDPETRLPLDALQELPGARSSPRPDSAGWSSPATAVPPPPPPSTRSTSSRCLRAESSPGCSNKGQRRASPPPAAPSRPSWGGSPGRKSSRNSEGSAGGGGGGARAEAARWWLESVRGLSLERPPGHGFGLRRLIEGGLVYSRH